MTSRVTIKPVKGDYGVFLDGNLITRDTQERATEYAGRLEKSLGISRTTRQLDEPKKTPAKRTRKKTSRKKTTRKKSAARTAPKPVETEETSNDGREPEDASQEDNAQDGNQE